MTDLTQREPVSRFQRILPGLTLMFLAPLVAEVLPGAMRVSSLFVLPIEIAIWGGGAVLIREAVRRLKLGWLNLLLLAVALSLAEECLIQQTSLAPLVIKLKGEEYARAFGINYVYLLWAIIYESTFVVFVPIGLAELIFNRRREQSWLSTAGIATICLLFIPACFLAWFTWTHIARTKVFHLDAYNPPTSQIAAAALTIAILIALAVGPLRMGPPRSPRAIARPHPVVLFILSGIAVSVLFGLLLLAFGISPSFPPSAAVAIGIALQPSRWSSSSLAFTPIHLGTCGTTSESSTAQLFPT